MNGLDAGWLVLAGFGGGLAGSIAGLASLVSYPALLAVGLPPISANVSNTVALVFSSGGSIWGSRPELSGQRGLAPRLCALALAGGLLGGILLLLTPSGVFARIVPWLIGCASCSIALTRRPRRLATASSTTRSSGLLAGGVFLVAVYGGYFGAAAGVMLLALLLLETGEPLARSNAMKNVLAGVANAVAAVLFVFTGPVRWTAVLPLAAGFLVGGRIGPMIVRRAPPGPLRLLIGVAGLALAVHLGLDAYR